jgi:hypothetical protein
MATKLSSALLLVRIPSKRKSMLLPEKSAIISSEPATLASNRVSEVLRTQAADSLAKPTSMFSIPAPALAS